MGCWRGLRGVDAAGGPSEMQESERKYKWYYSPKCTFKNEKKAGREKTMVSVLTRAKKCAKISFVFEKDAGVAQSVEQLIRNQQVRCSSHPTSSKKHRKLRFLVLFCCKNAESGVGQNAGQLLTHTVTHTRKCANRFKEYRRGGFAPSPIFLMFFFCSHHLCHETAHFLRSLLLHLPCGVGVGAESESGIIVAEHTADGFDVHAILQCQGRERMSQVVEPDMLQPASLRIRLWSVTTESG